MLWVTDVDCQCTFLSQSWYDFTGQVEPDGFGLGWLEGVHPDDRDDVQRIFLAAMEQREPYEIDFRLRTADGSYRWVIDSGRPRIGEDGSFEGYVGSVIDADERQRAQAAIAISEERLRTAAAAAGFGMLHADIEAGVVTYSQEMKSLLRLPDDADRKLTPGAMPDWVQEDDRAACGEFYRVLLGLPEGESNSIDHRVIRPDGELRWIRLQAKPIHTGTGKDRKATQLIGTIVDITQQREFEESLQQARTQAVAASESKSAFLANMSHEIRTPMTAILGYADLLREHLSNEEAIGHLGTIRRNGGYLLEIINDILDLSKIEAGKFEVDRSRFAVTKVLEDVRSIMEVRAKEGGLTLDVGYEGKLPSFVESDPKCLKQILINLVGNAIKFTKKGGVKIVVEYLRAESSRLLARDKSETLDEFRYDRMHPFSNHRHGHRHDRRAASQAVPTVCSG